MRRLLSLARPLRMGLLLSVLAGAGTIAAGIALLAVSGWLIARASQHPNESILAVAVVGVRTFGIARGVLRYTERLVSHDSVFRVLADLRVRVFRTLIPLVPGGVGRSGSGDLLARLVADVDGVQDVYLRGITPPLVAFLAGGGAVLATTIYLIPAGAALAAGLVLAGVALPLLSAATARRAGERIAGLRGELAEGSVDLIDGAAELLAFGGRQAALARLAATDDDLATTARSAALATGLGQGMLTLLTGLTVWSVLALSLVAVSHGLKEQVALTAFVLLTMASFEAVTILPGAAAQWGQVRGSARRIVAVLDMPVPVVEPATPTLVPDVALGVDFDHVTASYPGEQSTVLSDVSVQIDPGQLVAIVGPSGAGKSTFAALLTKFVTPSSGALRLGGIDLTDITGEQVRAHVGGTLADPHIFDTTLAENLRLARPDASEADMVWALTTAGLGPMLDHLPDGLATDVGTHGARLSGGQRQRVALARTLLADPDVVVLDEPTAHVDPDGRRELAADLRSIVEGRTCVWITHDPAEAAGADTVVVLDGGRVIEQGSPRELAATGGWYATAMGTA